MGWGGKVEERTRARELRAAGWTMPDIAQHLGVSRSSVSLWTRDVETPPMVRRRTRSHTEHPAKLRARAEVAEMDTLGRELLGGLSDQAFLAAGAALYAGEGAKNPGTVMLANTNPDIARFFVCWLRRCFDIEEHRLRVRVYLHDDQDLPRATQFWAEALDIPTSQFGAPHLVPAGPTRRRAKHTHGCVYVSYSSSRLHRQVMGLVRALLQCPGLPG